MLYGVREICDVFVKAKTNGQKVGEKEFRAGEPVCHFNSLKTSSMEGQSTVVYAQGGKGNPRLVTWEGERVITFTMEDALISPMGIALLTGAELVKSGTTDGNRLKRHVTLSGKVTKTGSGETVTATVALDELSKVEIGNATLYTDIEKQVATLSGNKAIYKGDYPVYIAKLDSAGDPTGDFCICDIPEEETTGVDFTVLENISNFNDGDTVMVDCYVTVNAGEQTITQFDITPDKFSGNFYFEGSTLFRNKDGKDYQAEFIIPNGKIQSNFTFTMAGSGDPSTFTFTVDAMVGITKNNPSKKVNAVIQIVEGTSESTEASYPDDDYDS